MRSFNSARDGRSSWIALLIHFEGDTQRDRVKDAAYAAIANAKYYGEKKCFSFETYVTIHQEAYKDLEQYGETISEDKRVWDLLQGIKDPTAKAARETVLATPHLRNSFTNAVTHLAPSLQLNLSVQDPWNISVTNTSAGQGDSNHGGRGGCWGHVQGRGRGGESGGWNIYLGSYSPEQWRKLSAGDKKHATEGHQRSAEQRTASVAQGTQHCNLSLIGTSIGGGSVLEPDAQTQITIPTAITDTQSTSQSQARGEKRSNPESVGSHIFGDDLLRLLLHPGCQSPISPP
jgi:hypothetical protein